MEEEKITLNDNINPDDKNADDAKPLPVSQKNKGSIYALLSYVWILCLIPLFLKKEDEYISFHAKQGFAILVIEVLAGLLIIIPVIGGVLSSLISLICIALSLLGVSQVVFGKEWSMPLVGILAEKLPV